jgi:hypothetical protein
MNDASKRTCFRVPDSVKSTETQDGAVLLDVKQGLCFSINPVGMLVWKRVRDGCTTTQIAQYLAETFSISPEQARNDTQEFLHELMEKRLVQEEEDRTESSNGRRGWIAETFPSLWKLVRSNRTRQME